jgi:SAM-dependent methyltransferase
MKKSIWTLAFLAQLCLVSCDGQPKPAPGDRPPKDSIYTYRNASADGTGKFYFGREIARVMSYSGSGWLDRDSRGQEENTKLAIESMKLATNAAVADIGAGTGYYSFKISAKIPAGKLYAVEIQDEMIRMLKERKEALKDNIVEIVKGSEKSPNLPENSIDLAIMVDVYHELEYPHEMLQAIHKALKKNGKLLLIEYRGEDPAVQIKKLHKTTIEQLTRELGANGFKLSYRGDFLPIQHFVLFEKVE